MTARKKTLFDPIVAVETRHPLFESLRIDAGPSPARWMIDRVYQSFDDPEGNFLEQFQTTGFDARLFELYLFAYFCASGFDIDRRHPNPDFLVSRNGAVVAVEATTVNPSMSGFLATAGRKISELTADERLEYQRNELAIRFGSPLFSKLQKKYWELEHCRDLPLVIAIAAFHDPESLTMSDVALARYLFGHDQTGSWTQDGALWIETVEIDKHSIGDKVIPSHFFRQPGAQHISAVLFTNSGTCMKFARMGYQCGIGNESLFMVREGRYRNRSADAMDPTFLSYSLDAPPFVEPWGQGLVVLHNPNATNPVPAGYFVDAVEHRVRDGALSSTYPATAHPFSSWTHIMDFRDSKKMLNKILLPLAQIAIGAIGKAEFQELCGLALAPDDPVIEEQGWFADDTDSFLGVVTRDKVDDDWGYVLLARDDYFQFGAIEQELSLKTRHEALGQLCTRMRARLASPQRLFSHDSRQALSQRSEE